MCYADGDERKAVIEYIGDDDVHFHACKKHSKLVRDAGLTIVEEL